MPFAQEPTSLTPVGNSPTREGSPSAVTPGLAHRRTVEFSGRRGRSAGMQGEHAATFDWSVVLLCTQPSAH